MPSKLCVRSRIWVELRVRNIDGIRVWISFSMVRNSGTISTCPLGQRPLFNGKAVTCNLIAISWVLNRLNSSCLLRFMLSVSLSLGVCTRNQWLMRPSIEMQVQHFEAHFSIHRVNYYYETLMTIVCSYAYYNYIYNFWSIQKIDDARTIFFDNIFVYGRWGFSMYVISTVDLNIWIHVLLPER